MSWVHARQVLSLLYDCVFIPLEPEHWDFECLSELLQGESAHLDPAKPADGFTKQACLMLCVVAQITSRSLGRK